MHRTKSAGFLISQFIKKGGVVFFGIACYLLVNGAVFYLIGFIINIGVPKSIDGPATKPIIESLLINVGLLLLFGLQHSIMARKSWKEKYMAWIPTPLQRSVYGLVSVAILALLMWQWCPLPTVIWTIHHPALRTIVYGLFVLGLSIMLLSTYLIDHYELFGIRQVLFYAQDKDMFPERFKAPWLYQYVRHPMMLGFLIGFWATPEMTVGHLVFALGMSVYILIGISYEEKDLVQKFGKLYIRYRSLVPKIIPAFYAYRNKHKNLH
ncbi:isoprenylcysteine carboxylmethyltransferase family protein [Rhodocytophaga rosea]|uniref:methanethiol S-methyltransferase n=1 Tax=Rhodocytophaga rosea TaxID=2704465 RepID=A0A6C0GJ56_9BACT|nr:methanethiol S-methyltransferase [Rhodocytophaga rosea]QHT68066.1 isoprenylcysteine carboxylmethyltransferase family protein [Rhodocytophaga rosea]